MKKKRLLLLITGGILLFPTMVYAQVSCVIDRSVVSKNIIIQGADITVGVDSAVGTVIYTGYVNTNYDPSGYSAMTCRYNPGETFSLHVANILVGGGYATISDKVLSTNIPGVGVRFRNNFAASDKTYLDKTSWRYSFTTAIPNAVCTATYGSCNMASGPGSLFELVKTGDIYGGYLSGTSFPKISIHSYTDTPGVTVQQGEIGSVYFSGGINIKQATCQTPGDFTVNLGKFDVTEIQKKGASPFVDATITLTGCPQFTGMPGTRYSQWDYPTETPTTMASNVSNIMEVRLTPLNAIRSAASGTFLIDNGSGSASGVDIQVYRGTVTSGTAMPLGQSVSVYFPGDGRNSVSYPLAARYLKNSDKLSPGAANGKMVYTINYK